jgi:tetratricopeptide (TPR) repeat protein
MQKLEWLIETSQSAAREGALLCSEGLALLEAFRGRVDAARGTFRAAAEGRQPSGRLLREWALFEKRQGRLQVLRAQPQCSSIIIALLPACKADQRPLWLGRLSVECVVSTRHVGGCLQEASNLFARAAAADPQDERTWLAAALLERRRENYSQVSGRNGKHGQTHHCFRL